MLFGNSFIRLSAVYARKSTGSEAGTITLVDFMWLLNTKLKVFVLWQWEITLCLHFFYVLVLTRTCILHCFIFILIFAQTLMLGLLDLLVLSLSHRLFRLLHIACSIRSIKQCRHNALMSCSYGIFLNPLVDDYEILMHDVSSNISWSCVIELRLSISEHSIIFFDPFLICLQFEFISVLAD